MSVQVQVDHRPKLGPVRDQGRRATCLAHATSVVHEVARGSCPPLSPEYLHWFSALPGRGARVGSLADALRTRGQPHESDCPYGMVDPSIEWVPPAAKVYRRGSDTKKTSIAALLALLLDAVAVLVITLPDSFYRPTSPWVIRAAGPHRANHAVAGVGVGTLEGDPLVLIRNSWGEGWGEGGHAWLDSTFLDAHLNKVLVLTHEVNDA
jgi:hypothetical protein